MRVDERLRKTVVYVGFEANGVFVPYGTGFFCRYEKDEVGWNFVATCQHVIDRIPGDKVFIRVNRLSGGAQVMPYPKAGGIRSKPELDIHLVITQCGADIFDFLCLAIDRTSTQTIYGEWEPNIGDEVCVSGLYTSHYGQVRNAPIVRVGHLAAMPEEPVRTDRGYIEGYIIEIHSIAGLSGSPVFVTPPPLVYDGVLKQPKYRTGYMHMPIGMLLGHHVIETREDEIGVPQFQSAAADSAMGEKNTGFGVVVPIERIYDMVDNMRGSFNASIAAYRRERGFVPDSAGKQEPPAKGPNPSHKEDFTRLLDAASQPPKSDDQT